ncbi:PTS cellobiose transporter subunit IIA [Vagococcus sp. DIV0080]|uniref:PTS cellobiose transporter subunit IIA n=1 Tax=Candidatus Vagococcus giribetii TaxID=2230876 RepID=A0ABS3HTZ8_9ENTE|nr:PTS cellobiose transporter subunit IIA [Vagococcus sp. DIV0080]MBO0477184.1 PTS cellobiose transporter subunit IIA [Vagococcus sp. DIV0080]
MENTEELQVVAFEIILHSGNARTSIHKAFSFMRNKEFIEAEAMLDEANNSILVAHQSQTKLLKDYANGKKIEMEIIMVHAQDHLMTTMTLLEVAKEMAFLYKER